MPLGVRDSASSRFQDPRFPADPRGRCCTVHSFAPSANLSFTDSETCLYSPRVHFLVNTKRYWFPCQNTWVLWDRYLSKQWHCEQNTVSFHTRECICKYGIEFINILWFADKGLNFKHPFMSWKPPNLNPPRWLSELPAPVHLCAVQLSSQTQSS